ncbi:MAG: hypothetical protein SGI77_13580 [Pirellulaceae bacterium]|nr:hypothetical protein [Pirellulaceae bacterium]
MKVSTLLGERHPKNARSQLLACERPAIEAPPRVPFVDTLESSTVRQAEPAVQWVPRRSLGTSWWRSLRRSLLILAVLGGLSWGFNRTFLVAEQSSPAPPLKSVEPINPSSGETPLSPIIPKEPDDVRNDPLYQSILEQLKEGRAALLPTDHPSSQNNATESPASPTTAEWHAIELILRAARILEREEIRMAESRKAKPVDERSSIPNQLRSQALKIIQSGSNK